ncbi:MAG: ABC transporter substrate binding protein [Burkholderiales bacterium]|nr:ABC transporter substrate binding protein [Burkholderiales bacterium]
MRQRLHKVMQAMLAIVLFCAMGFAHGQTQILLVLSDGSGACSEVAAAMQSYFATHNSAFDIRTINTSAFSDGRVNFTETDIIVAIGTYAMEQVSVDARVPVLNILVPRQSYESTRLRAKHDSRQYSAIYLDQPLTRQLQLIKAALPNRDAVGVLLGPSSQDRLKPLQQAAREQKVGVSAEQVTTEEDIIPALKRLFTSADVLLALPDPLVFNKHTAQSLLLTSYRAQIPLIAYSKSYVSAGALAAVYSTPAQIGQQAAELLMRLMQAKTLTLPPPQYPKYFSVNVNYQVARSLGLIIESEAALLEQIKAGTERE